MHVTKNKYSLWIVPRGETGERLQALTDKLADENDAPHFVPHLTLVANIFADDSEINGVHERIRQCTKQLDSFTIDLTSYGYLDEEFRCLYLLAENSEKLQLIYQSISMYFPQVTDEHFQAMPHLSVLYGDYSDAVKRQIIDTNPLNPMEFVVDSFELFITNSPNESWRLAQHFPLGGNEG